MDATIVFKNPELLAQEDHAEAYSELVKELEEEYRDDMGNALDNLECDRFVCTDCNFVRNDLRDSCPCQVRELPTGKLYAAIKELHPWLDGTFYCNGFQVVLRDSRNGAEITECYWGSYTRPNKYEVGRFGSCGRFDNHDDAVAAVTELFREYTEELN